MNFERHIVVIDTDIGDDIDDALALALALHSPELDILGVTTVFGDTEQRARLAGHLLQTFGREDIPVAAGQSSPILPRRRPSGVPQAALLDVCDGTAQLSPLSAPELIIQTALQYYGHLTLICLGPLTNIATALSLEPRLFMAIRNIVMMGGSSNLPWAEWNVRNDAKAAQTVLAAGIPTTMIGWNITTTCQLRKEDILQLRMQDNPQTRLLSQLIAVWQRHRPRWHPDLPFLHDPLTVVALCAADLLQFEEMTARVITRGPLTGFMVPRVMDGPLVHAAVGIKVEQARDWIMGRLLQRS